MEIPLYLAMTASEIAACKHLPRRLGWMACHFDPAGTGLRDFPPAMPQNSLVILDDSIPFGAHDPNRIAAELKEALPRSCSGLLLDFQRSKGAGGDKLIGALQALPCPVIISKKWHNGGSFPIFLPPIPPDQSPEEYLSPYAGQNIWLEAARDSVTLELSAGGNRRTEFPQGLCGAYPHEEKALFCHYRIEEKPESILFTLRRTPEDLRALLAAVKDFGVTHSVGLFQELGAEWA